LHFTNIFSLEKVVFADGTTSGSSFADTADFKKAANTGQFNIITIVSSYVDATHNKLSLRINGYSMYTTNAKNIQLDCSKQAPTASPFETCSAAAYGALADTICSPSELFCKSPILKYLADSQHAYRSYIGKSATTSFTGHIAELSLFDTKIDMDKDDEENFRRIEAAEWYLATKYRMRTTTGPARPPAPFVRNVPEIRGVEVSFPKQATYWTTATIRLKVSGPIPNPLPANTVVTSITIDLAARQTVHFVPSLANGVYEFSIVVQINANAPAVSGFVATHTVSVN
jgi:hypothetical protein